MTRERQVGMGRSPRLLTRERWVPGREGTGAVDKGEQEDIRPPQKPKPTPVGGALWKARAFIFLSLLPDGSH